MTYGKTSNWSDCVGNNGNYIFRNMTEDPANSRKRLREDDSCEFMPLSKRINNLHINNSMTNINNLHINNSMTNINNLHINNSMTNTSMSQMNPVQMNSQHPESSHNHNHNATDHEISSPSSSSDSDQRPNYDPGVNPAASNYYFDNKLLFELHLERVERTGQQFPY